jgi:hypothetical protein
MAVKMHPARFERRRRKMNPMFDIFQGLPDGNFLWIAAVGSLHEARHHINRLALVEPGRYLIHSQQRGLVVEHVDGSDNLAAC